MINCYDNNIDEYGNLITNRTKLFIRKVNEENEIEESFSGTRYVPEGAGTLFIVDDWIIPQLDKILFVNGELKVKDGEEIVPPVKTERQLQIEKLQRQLAELESMSDEPSE